MGDETVGWHEIDIDYWNRPMFEPIAIEIKADISPISSPLPEDEDEDST